MEENASNIGNTALDDAIRRAVAEKRHALSEHESKLALAAYGVPVVTEWLCATAEEAGARAAECGGPVALKLCSPDVAHKKEHGFVALGLGAADIERAARDMLERAAGLNVQGLLVQPMARGERELLAGMRRDPVFGVLVTLGLGGIFTEALDDVAVRTAPLTERDAADMLTCLRSAKMFGQYRGLKPVDAGALARLLSGLGELGLSRPEIREVDVNPVIVGADGSLTAVDALILLEEPA